MITFCIDKKVLRDLRDLREQSDNKHGFLGRTTSEALRQYLKEQDRPKKEKEDARRRLLLLLHWKRQA